MTKKLTLEEAMLKGLKKHALEKLQEKKLRQKEQKEKKPYILKAPSKIQVLTQVPFYNAGKKIESKIHLMEERQKGKGEKSYDLKPLKPTILKQVPMYYDGRKIEAPISLLEN